MARPRIRIRLLYGSRFVELLALVDSGADDCIFPAEVAQDLGIPLDDERTMKYRGVGSGHITAYFADIVIDVGGTRFPLYAGFSDAPSVVPLLGQAGFFDRFEVRFNRPKEIVELKVIGPAGRT